MIMLSFLLYDVKAAVALAVFYMFYRLMLRKETFLWWDEKAQDMVPVRGNYELLYGGSSADAALQCVSYRF